MFRRSFTPVDPSSSSHDSHSPQTHPLFPTILPSPDPSLDCDNLTSIQLIALILQQINEAKPIKHSHKSFRRVQSMKHHVEVSSGCTCKKTKCLKMYCECFSSGGYCKPGCSCLECSNNEEGEEERVQAIVNILERDPYAFNSKEAKQNSDQSKGCNCKKSGCEKKYCECFTSGNGCTLSCRCWGCKNSKPLKTQLKIKKFLSFQEGHELHMPQ